MKKLILLPLVLAFASNAAMAANSVDLRVTGTITPAACGITLAGGDFDLSNIDIGTLSASTSVKLPESAGKTLSITCSGATQVAFKAIDNRKSSAPFDDSDEFGLGTDSQNAPIGSYEILVNQPSILVDSAAGQIKSSDDEGTSWMGFSATDLGLLSYTKYPRIFALDKRFAGPVSQPVPTTNASALLKVVATIQPTNTLDTSAEITLDGSATIELVYL
ncbi:DUF1120 domain-containing protein [Pseudomonas sp. NPDC098747]|uniref:DUF1120 domain-containing protein n=1 Tax=Pseudomonas sp. NPDC098747 TaxID=3364487 RepID=UPI00383B3F90